MTATQQQDIVSASILQSKFEAVVAEMEKVLINTAYSKTISESHQCSAAIFTENGQLIAVSNPVFMYPLVMTAERIIDYFQYDLSADDILITNDPYGGGTRVQNFTIVAPVSDGESISHYVAVCGQTEDFGGDIRGNLNPQAVEIWAEGARCSPVRLVREGKFCKDVMQTLALNSRNPDAFNLDVGAMRAAVDIGRQRFSELLDRHGASSLLAAVDWILDYSERRTRSLIERIPEGYYKGEGVLAHDGAGQENLTVRVTVEVGNNGLTFDFAGTDPQSTRFVNASRSITSTFASLPFISAFGGEVPLNAGMMRCLHIRTPEGSLVNPTFPAPVGWGGQHLGNEIADAVGSALGDALPEHVGKITSNTPLLFSVYKLCRHGNTLEQVEAFDLSNFVQGDANATSGHDGWGMPGIAARVPLPSVELYESWRGGMIRKLEYAIDSAGPGANRGSPGTVSVITLPLPDKGQIHLTAMVTPQAKAPITASGALSGADNRIAINMNGEHVEVATSVNGLQLSADAEIIVVMGGGSGWGNPHSRSPGQVRTDVVDGLVSIEAALLHYQVVVDPDTFEIDEAATARLRASDAKTSNFIEEHLNG